MPATVEEINIPICEDCLKARKYGPLLRRLGLGKNPEISQRRSSRVNVCYICNKRRSDIVDVTFTSNFKEGERERNTTPEKNVSQLVLKGT